MSIIVLRDDIKLQLDTQLGAFEAGSTPDADRLKIAQAFADAIDPHFAHADATAETASPTTSGTVKTDVLEADPVVYVSASVDSLLSNKSDLGHTHTAGDVGAVPTTGGSVTGTFGLLGSSVTVDGGVTDSQVVYFRGYYDSDATTAIASTPLDLSLKNRVISSGDYRLAIINNAGTAVWETRHDGVLVTGTVPWARLSNVPVYATRWPTAAEAGAASASHDHSEIVEKPDYSYAAATAPRSFPERLFFHFAWGGDGWPMSYQRVFHMPSHAPSQDGGALQIASPYAASYSTNGNPMFRTGYYNNAGWSAWKTFADMDWVTANYSNRRLSLERVQDLSGSYGSINIEGSTNGYAGINFITEGVTFMVNGAGAQGVYNNSGSWQWYFSNGVLSAGSVPAARLSGGNMSGSYTATGNFQTNAECYVGNWLRLSNNGGNRGIYWQAGTGAGWHIYHASAEDMYIRSGSTLNSSLRFTINGDIARGYIHWTTTNEIGFLTSGRAWALQCFDNKMVRVHGALDVVSQIDVGYGVAANTIYANRSASSSQGGVSLYSTDANTYAIAFRGTGYGGTHGAVTGNWATYFSVDQSTGRGWVFTTSMTTTGGNVASISNTGVVYAASYYTTSSRASKKNIRPFERSAIEIIRDTEIVEFAFKDDPDERHRVGFIADDTDSVMSGEKQDSFDTTNTVAVLMKAVQELIVKNEALEERLRKAGL